MSTRTGLRRVVVVPSPSLPSPFAPQQRRVSSAIRAQAWSRAVEISTTPCSASPFGNSPGAKTSTGFDRFTVVPSPSRPFPLLPQQRAVPSVSRAHVDSSPAEICATPRRTLTPCSAPSSRTCTGERLLTVVPSPSWPAELSPQQRTVPSVINAHVCRPPAAICGRVSPSTVPEASTVEKARSGAAGATGMLARAETVEFGPGDSVTAPADATPDTADASTDRTATSTTGSSGERDHPQGRVETRPMRRARERTRVRKMLDTSVPDAPTVSDALDDRASAKKGKRCAGCRVTQPRRGAVRVGALALRMLGVPLGSLRLLPLEQSHPACAPVLHDCTELVASSHGQPADAHQQPFRLP
jgi:hypothetical protein